MSPAVAAAVVLLGSYLVGAIPVGFLIGLTRGVNLFRVGSGNIGSTNVFRTLGAKLGTLCFVLDYLKGAGPVAAAVPLASQLHPDAVAAVGGPDVLRVLAAALAFFGHMFPIYLGFRGGKGVATGAGAVCVLVPGPAALAMFTWVVVTAASRAVSLGSVLAVVVLSGAWLATAADPFAGGPLAITAFLLLGSAAVVGKHRANVRRLFHGTENLIGDSPMRRTFVKGLHLVAVGLGFGGAAFFNFGAAPAIFASFQRVVDGGPSDRTAGETLLPADASPERKAALANALAGAAVGPVFPRYFGLQAVCGGVALVTALSWWRLGRVHRVRVGVVGLGLLTVAIGWPLSNHVSELRPRRFDPDPAVAAAAKSAFVSMHLASLGLSFVTVSLAGAALALGAKLPDEPETEEPT
ncbi:MAG: glycerol-3-phosphate acyltransferase [Fimbriiglobus sp.]